MIGGVDQAPAGRLLGEAQDVAVFVCAEEEGDDLAALTGGVGAELAGVCAGGDAVFNGP